MLKNGTWDVRVPKLLKDLFPKEKRRGYYYKVNRKVAQEIVNALSDEYSIPQPNVSDITPRNCNGRYWPIRRNSDGYSPEGSRIDIWPSAHLKTVFHEWYHHLDNCTNGEYNSNDNRGGASSLAWQFAEKLWEEFRKGD